VGANIGKEGRSIRSLAAADMAEGLGQATALLKREFGVSIPIDKIPGVSSAKDQSWKELLADSESEPERDDDDTDRSWCKHSPSVLVVHEMAREVLRSPEKQQQRREEARAATILQSVLRSRIARAAVQRQRVARQEQERRRREERAATLLQSMVRGRIARAREQRRRLARQEQQRKEEEEKRKEEEEERKEARRKGAERKKAPLSMVASAGVRGGAALWRVASNTTNSAIWWRAAKTTTTTEEETTTTTTTSTTTNTGAALMTTTTTTTTTTKRSKTRKDHVEAYHVDLEVDDSISVDDEDVDEEAVWVDKSGAGQRFTKRPGHRRRLLRCPGTRECLSINCGLCAVGRSKEQKT